MSTHEPPPPGWGSGAGDGPPPFPSHSNPGQPPPDNNLVWGILVTILCCLPFGIVSIVKSTKVDRLWMTGHHQEARAAADSARNWAIAGAATAAGLILLWFIAVFAMGVSALSVFEETQTEWNY